MVRQAKCCGDIFTLLAWYGFCFGTRKDKTELFNDRPANDMEAPLVQPYGINIPYGFPGKIDDWTTRENDIHMSRHISKMKAF